jgi:hypothetical protein
VLSEALHVNGRPWWESHDRQLLVSYPGWGSVKAEFPHASREGWYLDCVVRDGRQFALGRAATTRLAAAGLPVPDAGGDGPLQVLWSR